MSRTGPTDPPRPRRRLRGIERLTLTDPWGECDLLWRDPDLAGFPLLDAASDGWYGVRPLDGPQPIGEGPGSLGATAPKFLLLYYGLRPVAPAGRFALSAVLVEPAGALPSSGTRRVEIALGIEAGYAPSVDPHDPKESGYGPRKKGERAFRTLGLVAGEVDGSRPDLCSLRPLFLDFQLRGVGFPGGGHRAVVAEPAP